MVHTDHGVQDAFIPSFTERNRDVSPLASLGADGDVFDATLEARWLFPHGIQLANYDPEHADYVASIINNQRRRSLDYKSPAELYDALIVQ